MKNDYFVIVWAVPPTKHDGGSGWIMVKHKERGWELPGGLVKNGEEEDEAALREFFEEVGLLGIAKSLDRGLVEGGCVVLVEVNEDPSPVSWKSSDDSIEEVGWCLDIPEGSSWGKEEIRAISSHDWRTSITLGS